MKTLLFDLETSPIIAYTWAAYETSIIEEIEESKIISISYKWLDEKQTYVKALCDFSGYKKNILDDAKLMRWFAPIIEEADVVVAHNGKAFDVKTLNTRFLVNGLDPPKPYITIDTKKISTKYFRFARNKLETLVRTNHLGEKMSTGGFELWKGCEAGDARAWKKMKEYNKHDVVILEKLYLKYRPWFTSELPNTNIIDGTVFRCTACGSKYLHKRGFWFTRTGKRQKYQCQSCGHWEKGKHTTIQTIIK